MRIALVHDWLTGMRGGEKVLEAFAELWPDAELFTLFQDASTISEPIRKLKRHTSFLQRIPGITKRYRTLLPLMLRAIERFDLRGFDLVLSSSHCVAKGVRIPEGVPHLCYCHSPMRYAWHQRDLYLKRLSPIKRSIASMLLDRLRQWDFKTAYRVTQFIANGRNVQTRIKECYGRDSIFIHPPVDTEFYSPAVNNREAFYLIVAGLVPNKGTELAVEACQKLERELIIIGSGPDLATLQRMANHRTNFLGWQSNEVIRDHYRRCQALLFPGEDDFGIVPLEAQSCGSPVIAYGKGGALETILVSEHDHNSTTGLLFDSPQGESLAEAILRFEAHRKEYRPEACRRNALQYGKQRFKQQIQEAVSESLAGQVSGRIRQDK